jgi:agmatine deiminase
MTTLKSTPRDDGFHMPAEWAPQTQTWMIWPERPDNWRLGGKPAQAAHAAVAKAIARFEPVTVAVSAGQYENARARLDVPNIRVVEMSSDDAWVRDTGPTFVINNSGEVRGVNWDFNAWGGFEGGLYSPWNRDSQVGGKILEIERSPRYRTEGFVLEGGSIHVDGEGTLITTEECLLNHNRNRTWVAKRSKRCCATIWRWIRSSGCRMACSTTKPTAMWITSAATCARAKYCWPGPTIRRIRITRAARPQ